MIKSVIIKHTCLTQCYDLKQIHDDILYIS